jgi:hypothetical protein
MLSGHYNGKSQTEAEKRTNLALKVSYTPNLTDKLNTALQFVINKMGFIQEQKVIFNHEPLSSITLIDPEGKTLTITLDLVEKGTGIENITFHTEDCLRDYHKYLMSGVEFISRPEYHTAGLQVNFIDNENNHYTLLEERIYTES